MSDTRHISREDLALYSMQVLPPAENEAVQAHLNTCIDCRAALAETLADLSLIGLSAPVQPLPEGAQQRFMSAVQNNPQTKTGPGLVALPAPAPSPQRAPRFGWQGWLGWAIAIAAIIAAIVLGVRDSALQSRLNEDSGQIAQLSAQVGQAQNLEKLMDALTSPEAKQVTLMETKHPAQPMGHATYLWQSGTLVFVASNMRPVPAGKTYELWLIPENGQAPVPAGLFRPDASGSASVVMPPLPAGIKAKAFGITVEPAQGSTTPTLPIVMSGG